MASDVYSAVGLVTTGDLSTYDVLMCTKGKAADNQSYVSSQTGGKTYRVEGNLDATWELSLKAKDGESEVPSAFRPGQVISVQLQHDTQVYTMIVDTSSLEVDIASGALVGISLSCSADSSTSYHVAE